MGKAIQITDDAGMSIEEVRRFEQLDGRIERGVRSFVEVGQALAEVRDDKLYRKDFGSFEAYCESRGISKQRVYQLMDACEVGKNLSTNGGRDVPPLENERQARELAKLPADQQADAFIEASERTNGKPTAAAIKQVIAERKAPTTFGTINTDDEPTAADDDNARPEPDEDEIERKAANRRFIENAPFVAAAEAEKTFHGRKVPADAPPLNLKEIRDNDPAVRWARILGDLADCISRLPDRSSLEQLPSDKRNYVSRRIGEISAALQEVIK